MITIRIYGLMRLKTGIRELKLEEGAEGSRCIEDCLNFLLAETKQRNAEHSLTFQELKQCVLMVNGISVHKLSFRLKPGDVLVLLSPAGGG